MMLVYEPYMVNSWLDRGMSVQVPADLPVAKKRNNGAGNIIGRWVSASVIAAVASFSNFSWAGTTQVPFSSIHAPLEAAQAVDWGDAVPAQYYENLISRLRGVSRSPDDSSVGDPDSFF